MKRLFLFFCLISNLSMMADYFSYEEIIGIYRVFFGKPITVKKLIKLKKFSNSRKMLLYKILNSQSSINYLNLDLRKNISNNVTEKKYKLVLNLNEEELEKLNILIKSNLNLSTVASNSDISSVYKLIVGKDIPDWEMSVYMGFKPLGFQMIAYVFLSRPEALKLIEFKSFSQENIEKIRLKNGMYMFGLSTDRITRYIAHFGEYEPYIEMISRKILLPGGVAIDVGANIGYHTMIFAELVGDSGKVFAFEPQKDLIDLINMSIEENKLKNVKGFANAVSDKEEQLYFTFSPICPGWSGVVDKNFAPQFKEIYPGSIYEAKSITIDKFAIKNNLDRLDLIKVDVEGFEVNVLEGAFSTISKFKPDIICEFNLTHYRNIGIDPVKFLNKFEELGYKFAIIMDITNSISNWYGAKEFISILDSKNIVATDILMSIKMFK